VHASIWKKKGNGRGTLPDVPKVPYPALHHLQTPHALHMARRWSAAAALLALSLASGVSAINELLPTCSSQVFRGVQDTVPTRVLVVEIGSDTSSCSSTLQATFASLQSYMTTAGRGDTVTYFQLNARTTIPDLTFIDQIWVRGCGCGWGCHPVSAPVSTNHLLHTPPKRVCQWVGAMGDGWASGGLRHSTPHPGAP
jgi:hypothetical protein